MSQASNTTPRPLSASKNASGQWQVGGCDLEQLAERFGTPLYVLDRSSLERACQDYLAGLSDYPGPKEVFFASKALPVVAIDRLLHEMDLGIEASSGGELFVAITAGVPGSRIQFNGNNKSLQELKEALDHGVGRFLVDGMGELTALSELSKSYSFKPSVTLRVNPGIDAHTHDFIRTGQVDSKFGFSDDQLEEAFGFLANKDCPLDYRGLQGHIGSQIFEVEPFRLLAAFLFDKLQAAAGFGLETEELNLGGGLGISYLCEDNPPPIQAFVRKIASFVVEEAKNRALPLPRLVLEPGRSIVGTAGFTLYRVGNEKKVPGIRRYLMVDGGMPDNPRPITYGAQYLADLVSPRERGLDTERVTIAGKCCESGDILIEDAGLEACKDDLLIVWATGAYCFAMSSNYNRLPRPAMVLLENGRAELIRRRETYDDLVRAEVGI